MNNKIRKAFFLETFFKHNAGYVYSQPNGNLMIVTHLPIIVKDFIHEDAQYVGDIQGSCLRITKNKENLYEQIKQELKDYLSLPDSKAKKQYVLKIKQELYNYRKLKNIDI